MYNLRTRFKAVLAGSARPQAWMKARALPAAASHVTATQALELFDDETVPETEVYGESVDGATIAVDDEIETVGATQPPTATQMPILSPIPPGIRPRIYGPRTPYRKDTPKSGILYIYGDIRGGY